MTSVLEKIVRPFQFDTRGVPPRRVPDTRQGAPERTILRIGRQGTGKTFNGSFSSTTTFYVDAHANEARQL